MPWAQAALPQQKAHHVRIGLLASLFCCFFLSPLSAYFSLGLGLESCIIQLDQEQPFAVAIESTDLIVTVFYLTVNPPIKINNHSLSLQPFHINPSSQTFICFFLLQLNSILKLITYCVASVFSFSISISYYIHPYPISYLSSTPLPKYGIVSNFITVFCWSEQIKWSGSFLVLHTA